ncbi:MAG TPA: hypothetical protein VF316_13610 [Polyangiaceae bacterium]
MSLARLALPAFLLAAACGATPEDPHHCGAQGYDCLGGTCSRGVCGPVTLVSGIKFGTALTVDSTRVYWIDWPNVSMAPKSGGPATLLATFSTEGSPFSIATDGTYAYVAAFGGNASSSGLYRIPTDGSAVTLLDAAAFTSSVAVDPKGCVEWSYGGGDPDKPGAIARLCPGSTKPEILADETDQLPDSLAVDATGTFWSEHVPSYFIDAYNPCAEAPGALRMVSPPSSPATVAHGYPAGLRESGTGLATGGDALYWRDMCSGTVYRLPHGASSPTALAAVSTTPASSRGFFPGAYEYPGLVAADALGVYTTSDAGVVRVPRDGGPTVLVALEQYPTAIAVDDTRIYLLAFNGALVAVAKPPR